VKISSILSLLLRTQSLLSQDSDPQTPEIGALRKQIQRLIGVAKLVKRQFH
jgi:hypothetical protein